MEEVLRNLREVHGEETDAAPSPSSQPLPEDIERAIRD
jgi:hypothetical protein